jgi:cell division protein FtsA
VGANFHIITGDKNAIRNINRSVEKSGLKIKDLMLQPLASAAAVMCDQDLEAGVAIVDIGGGTTDLAVFYEGILKHTAVIPYGGENITNDIKNGLGVLKTQAEQMKIQFGSALSDETLTNAYVTIPGLRGQQAKEISVKNLAHIIQARMQEVLEFVIYHLKQVGLDNKLLNGGIILTGGGSQLKHLIQLTEYVTGISARIGFPNEHLASGHIDELAKPMYATCIGLILKGYNDFENVTKYRQEELREARAVDLSEPESIAAEKKREKRKKEKPKLIRVDTNPRKSLKEFMDSMKKGLIDLFKEEEDTNF